MYITDLESLAENVMYAMYYALNVHMFEKKIHIPILIAQIIPLNYHMNLRVTRTGQFMLKLHLNTNQYIL